jgi:hypothetical protein
MGRHAEWEIVNRKPGIVLIRDLDRSGCLSITNDAEFVFDQLNSYSSKPRLRVIYQDTQGEWTEIFPVSGLKPGEWRVAFRPWHGEVWDNLTKTY